MNARTPQIDSPWATEQLELRVAASSRRGTEAPRSQIEAALGSEDALRAGLLSYALGAPIADVRTHFAVASQRIESVFALREMSPALLVEHATRNALGREIAHSTTPADAVDDSLANPLRALHGMYAALLVGAIERAIIIGESASVPGLHDVAGAGSWRSSVIAATHLLHGERDNALAALSTGPDTESDDMAEAASSVLMLRALCALKPEAFCRERDTALARFRANASLPHNRMDTMYLLCLPATGLTALGMHLGLGTTLIPRTDDGYLGIELLSNPGGQA